MKNASSWNPYLILQVFETFSVLIKLEYLIEFQDQFPKIRLFEKFFFDLFKKSGIIKIIYFCTLGY